MLLLSILSKIVVENRLRLFLTNPNIVINNQCIKNINLSNNFFLISFLINDYLIIN